MPPADFIIHKQHLQIEQWIDEQIGLSTVIRAVREVKAQIWRLETTACQRELTHLGAEFSNDTQWTGKLDTFQRVFQLNSVCQTSRDMTHVFPLRP